MILSLSLALLARPTDTVRRPTPTSPGESPEQTLYQQALDRYRTGDFPAAAAILERGVRQFPSGAGLHALLGWTRLRQSNLAGARSAFEQAARLEPKSDDAHAGVGYVALREKRPAEAEARFGKAVQLNPGNGDAWKGLAMARRQGGDLKSAHQAAARALALDPGDAEALSLLAQIAGPTGVVEERRARGPLGGDGPPRVAARTGRGRLEVRSGGGFRGLFVKGVNLGTALPGKFPAEFPDDPALYRRWFDQIGDLGMNVVRLYTLHPPSLYRALKEHNEDRPDRKLHLVQGVWTELPENDDYDDAKFMAEFGGEIRRVIDAVHGNLEAPPRPGHAGGVYDADVSGDVLAFLLGREWEPYSVAAYEKMRPGRARFDGEYVAAGPGARPFEAWLASICDLAAGHETGHYRVQRPIGYVSWPTLDPLHHVTEATAAEETAIRRGRGEKLDEPILEYDNDAVDIDARRIAATRKFPAGFFAAYHAYPYYPEFMILDPEYAKARDDEGPSHYLGYLRDLKAHHGDQPVLIAEFGVPSSRGIAHLQPEGQHHGGHTTVDQGRIDARLFRNIHDAGLAGGILFSWMDEWFKRNWLVMAYEVPAERNPLWLNALDAEQNYGLLAAWPGRTGWRIVLDGRGGDWSAVGPLYIDDTGPEKDSRPGAARRLRGLKVTSNEAYLYLKVDLDPGRGPVDWSRNELWIGIDTYDAARGSHRFPAPVNQTTPAGMEFLVRLAGKDSRILVDRPYDLFSNRNRRPYRSVSNTRGDFIEIEVFTNRDRYGRDGTYYPPQGTNRSPLRRGSMDPASPEYDTLSDWMESPDGSFIEARIAWGLLNVTDPSSHRVVHEEAARTGLVDTRATEGFRFHLLALRRERGALTITGRLPASPAPDLSDFPIYRWAGWDAPTYHLTLKDSYRILQEALPAIPTYD